MLSLVVPVFNEENLIDELVRRTVSAIESFIADYEIIFVDDGSTDRSLERILDYQKTNSKIKVLSLSRNFGHQAAYTAGLEYSKGDLVAMMDGDLQDPPEILAEMYRKIINEGFDVINARRTGRKGRKKRNLYTLMFHFVFRNFGEINNIGDYGNFSMFTRNAANALISLREKIRYMPGLRTIIGFRQGSVEYIRNDRFKGEPKMNLKKLFILATDAIYSFSKFPLRVCLFLGLAGTVVFLAAGIYVLIAKASGFAVPGWSSTLLSIYFLGSIQLVFLGILGEYVYRNYKESQNRPVYFVKKYFDGADGE
jgi:dolichol-phosphate mannosyltransferase